MIEIKVSLFSQLRMPIFRPITGSTPGIMDVEFVQHRSYTGIAPPLGQLKPVLIRDLSVVNPDIRSVRINDGIIPILVRILERCLQADLLEAVQTKNCIQHGDGVP